MGRMERTSHSLLLRQTSKCYHVIRPSSVSQLNPFQPRRILATGRVLGGKPSDLARPRQGHGRFDTYRFVEQVEGSGIPRAQAVVLMDQILLAITEANTEQLTVVATQNDLHSLKAEINEKVFSATLRFDVSQRHMKEMFKKEIMQSQADSRQEQKFDSAKLHDEITAVEKRVFERREADDMRHAQVHTEIANMERRITQYAAGAVATLVALGLTALRLAT